MRLLLIEDETELPRSICQYLERDNFICDASYVYPDAMERIEDNNYECILLDITLPGGKGLNILRRLKELGKSDAVLIISARDSLNDKLNGLNLGADDYLARPFHLPELSARVAAILRRKLFEGQIRIVTDDLTLDLDEKMVRGKKGYIDLTGKEYDLLLYFASNKNCINSFKKFF
jgi:DNA-binding response OmpR family regulator